MTISALVLTKNEEEMIEDCMKQLRFADEIIVLDQNSTDKTVKVAKKYTEKIFKSAENDFAKSRNNLKDLARGDWLLYVDADERFSKELIKELKTAISRKQFLLLRTTGQLQENASNIGIPKPSYKDG